jgi:hypothetical protein
MDFRKPSGGAAMVALALALTTSAAWAEKTLWLVRPLYPGQEALVERSEKALDKLTTHDVREQSVIGLKELGAALKGHVAGELPCFSAEQRCPDPIDRFVASLGFERIVLIQGGQDEAGFKYRVVAYEPKSGSMNPASATNANLEKALLGAVAKVVPVASTLEVKSTPPGATVFVDDVKVGVTPLTTQVIPGERVVKLDLKSHQALEETVLVPIRGAVTLEKTLEKVAARIVITALPAGTDISLDGQLVGQDRVDRGVAPGEHTIRLTAEGHKAFEQTISVRPDQQFSIDKTLEAIAPASKPDDAPKDKPAVLVVKEVPLEATPPESVKAPAPPPPPPPPAPSTPSEQVYERRQYVSGTYELGALIGADFVAQRFEGGGSGRTTRLTSTDLTLMGGGLEYGTFGKYFGLTVFGLSYLTNTTPWAGEVGFSTATEGCEKTQDGSSCKPARLDNLKLHLVTARAIHLQLRLAAWRFQLGLQLGPDFRVGWLQGTDAGTSTVSYGGGFWAFDLFVSGRANVRFYLVEGLFLALQGNFSFHVIGVEATDSAGGTFRNSHQYGFNGGLGYAF